MKFKLIGTIAAIIIAMAFMVACNNSRQEDVDRLTERLEFLNSQAELLEATIERYEVLIEEIMRLLQIQEERAAEAMMGESSP